MSCMCGQIGWPKNLGCVGFWRRFCLSLFYFILHYHVSLESFKRMVFILIRIKLGIWCSSLWYHNPTFLFDGPSHLFLLNGPHLFKLAHTAHPSYLNPIPNQPTHEPSIYLWPTYSSTHVTYPSSKSRLSNFPLNAISPTHLSMSLTHPPSQDFPTP